MDNMRTLSDLIPVGYWEAVSREVERAIASHYKFRDLGIRVGVEAGVLKIMLVPGDQNTIQMAVVDNSIPNYKKVKVEDWPDKMELRIEQIPLEEFGMSFRVGFSRENMTLVLAPAMVWERGLHHNHATPYLRFGPTAKLPKWLTKLVRFYERRAR